MGEKSPSFLCVAEPFSLTSNLIRHTTRLEMLFWVLSYYSIDVICNYMNYTHMSTDLLPQVFIKSGVVEWPGVIPVDSDRADCDRNNTLGCPVAAQLGFTIIQLLKAIVAAGAGAVCIHIQTHTSTNMPSYSQW